MRAICFLVSSALVFAGVTFAQLGAPPTVLYDGADIVFVGRLETITPAPSGLTARFAVNQLIKGQATTGKEVQVQVSAESSCHALEEQHRYLVYGRRIGDQLWVAPCEGSKLISQAEADLQYIHTVNPTVSEQCNRKRLTQLARRAPIVATARVISTEDSAEANPLSLRYWCGFAWSSEYAYYDVIDVLKGQIHDPKIAVEHAICWDAITVDGYSPILSPELFRQGNVLLLFLEAGSHRTDQALAPFKSGYEAVDENCGAVTADSDAGQSVVQALHVAR